MSLDTLGVFSVAASVSPTQTKEATANSLRRAVGAEERRVYYGDKAEAAAGVGAPDGEDHQTDDRGADGRRPWEMPLPSQERQPRTDRRSQDPSGQTGQLLDLTG